MKKDKNKQLKLLKLTCRFSTLFFELLAFYWTETAVIDWKLRREMGKGVRRLNMHNDWQAEGLSDWLRGSAVMETDVISHDTYFRYRDI